MLGVHLNPQFFFKENLIFPIRLNRHYSPLMLFKTEVHITTGFDINAFVSLILRKENPRNTKIIRFLNLCCQIHSVLCSIVCMLI